MRTTLDNLGESLAHAYLLVGEAAPVVEDLFGYLESVWGITRVGNPNIWYREYDRLGIDEVRSITGFESKSAMGEGQFKVIVLVLKEATVEAQNAMLKLIEEPYPDTIFFFIAPTSEQFLPTVRSRLQILLDESDNTSQERSKQIADFLSANYADRMKLCANLIGDSKKSISPNRTEAAAFLQALARVVYERKDAIQDWSTLYDELGEMAGYASDRSSSVKYIIEYVSIRLPLLD